MRIGAAGEGARRLARRKLALLGDLAEIEEGGEWARLAGALAGPGEPVDEASRGRTADLLGRDPGEALVHVSPHGGRPQRWPLAGAEAFTIGSHVFAQPGTLDQATAQGRGLLAHELAHVAQQSAPGGGTVQRASSSVGEAKARQVERRARRGASQSARGSLDPEKVAERVYELLRRDLRLERERLGQEV